MIFNNQYLINRLLKCFLKCFPEKVIKNNSLYLYKIFFLFFRLNLKFLSVFQLYSNWTILRLAWKKRVPIFFLFYLYFFFFISNELLLPYLVKNETKLELNWSRLQIFCQYFALNQALIEWDIAIWKPQRDI